MCIFTWIGNKSHPMAKLFYGQLPLCGCTTLENIQPVPNKGRNSPPVCPLAGCLVFGFCLPLRILSLHVVCLFFYFTSPSNNFILVCSTVLFYLHLVLLRVLLLNRLLINPQKVILKIKYTQ